MSANILIQNNRTTFRPNETVCGTVDWSGTSPPESARLQLFYFTEGKGTRDVVVEGTKTFPEPLAHDHRAFEFPLPPAPWSFHGRLVSVHWAMELILDRPPRDDVTRVEVVVSPTDEAVDIYDHEAVPDRQTTWQEFWQRYTG